MGGDKLIVKLTPEISKKILKGFIYEDDECVVGVVFDDEKVKEGS